MLISIVSTWSITSMVRSCDVPGGMSTIQKSTPVSSLGTRVDGVVLMSHTRMPMLAATMPAQEILWRMKKLVHLL